MKNLIRKILKESHNEKIIGILKKKFNFTDHNNIMHFLVSGLAYGYNEAIKIFAEWFKLETGLDWIDYFKSKNSILLGEKSNLFKDMFKRYEYFKNDFNDVYFFDNGHHFATLYMAGRFMELRHDGSLDEYGRRK